ncbi:hypothetical protein ACFLWY_01170 [Chloroflexota bacterium]
MSILKGVAVALLSFLLLLSLTIFGIAFTLNNTVLNPDFVVSELEQLDITSLAGEAIREQISQQIPPEAEVVTGILDEVIDEVLEDVEPQIREQANAAVYASYDYLLGRSEHLSLVISTGPIMESLKNSLRRVLLESPPPELAILPPELLEQYFDQFYEEFTGEVPATIEFDESQLPAEDRTQLELARQYIGYFQTGYKVLIGFMVLLVAGIILIYRDVKRVTRSLGSTFLTYGIVEYGGILAVKHFVLPSIPVAELPPPLQEWLPGVIGDFLAPLEMFSIGFLAAGIVLLVVSFVYKRRESSL